MPTPAQYTSIGVTTANLVTVIMWISKWPLEPPIEAQATALAGLILAVGALIHTAVQSYRGSS